MKFVIWRDSVLSIAFTDDVDNASKLLGVLHALAEATIETWLKPEDRAAARRKFIDEMTLS